MTALKTSQETGKMVRITKKWVISKTFEFCYGHRVWSQELNAEFADDLKCACRHLHGHEAKVDVYLEGSELTRGMITDFRHLEWAKKFLNAVVDHQFIIDQHDPLYDVLVGSHHKLTPVVIPGTEYSVGWKIDMPTVTASSHYCEMLEGYFIVDFVPTSENLAKWIFELVQVKMAKLNVKVSKVDWWETPKSRSTYQVDVEELN